MPAVERYGLRSANEKGGRATGELVRCTTGAAACGVGLASPACCWKRSTMADVKWGTLAASEGSWALLHRTGGSLLQLERGAVWRVGWGALAKPGGSLQLCCTGRESLVRRWVCSITPTTDGGLTRRPKGAVGLLHQEGEPRPTLNRQGDSRRGWRIGWRAPSNRREPAALLHRGGGGSLVRRRVCSIAQTTDGGLTRRLEGAVGLLHRKGSPVRCWESKETWLMEGLLLRPKGAAALLHRRGESPFSV